MSGWSAGERAIRVGFLARRDGLVCALCPYPIDLGWLAYPQSAMAPTIEHLDPRSRGGSLRSKDNQALAHRDCNNRRNDRDGRPDPAGVRPAIAAGMKAPPPTDAAGAWRVETARRMVADPDFRPVLADYPGRDEP